jgi:hypothetical protein
VQVVGRHHFEKGVATAFEFSPSSVIYGRDRPTLRERMSAGQIGVLQTLILLGGEAHRDLNEGSHGEEAPGKVHTVVIES